MAYVFEWDSAKAVANASTVFGDPLALLMPDPDHSEGEARYILLGMSAKQPDQSGGDMKRRRRGGPGADLDTLRRR